jgi:hypothetical protein
MKQILTAVILFLMLGISSPILAQPRDSDNQCVSHLPPTNLVATPLDVDEIRLTWTPGDDSGVGIDIERSQDGVVWEHINYGYPRGHYVDNYELIPGTTYYYRVRVSPRTRHTCASAYSNMNAGTTFAE